MGLAAAAHDVLGRHLVGIDEALCEFEAALGEFGTAATMVIMSRL